MNFLNNSTLEISLRQLFTRLALNELYSVTMGRIGLESLPAVLVETWCQTWNLADYKSRWL